MSLKDVMNRELIICNCKTPISGISVIMKEYNIGFIPIEENKKIIGVITDRDIVCSALANKCNINDPVRKYINTGVVSIDVNDSLEKALNLMEKNKVKRLIVSENKKIVGIVSLSDIISHDVDSSLIMNTIKNIWSISYNDIKYNTFIDDFYL